MASKGTLKVQIYKENSYIPVENAKVTILEKGESTTRQSPINLVSDSSGRTQEIDITAPSIEKSLEPTGEIPYSFVDIRVEANGFQPILVNNCQIYPDRLAIQNCNLKTTRGGNRQEVIINVQPNRLVGNYPNKIPEDPEKPLPPPPSGFVVLPQPVVPEFIVVHDGFPDDDNAPNYTVKYSDYIKNVACSEIFATWPESAIRANIYCIISFTLNRIYTEWYTGKGKNFNITSSTAYDHAFSYGRNIYDNISRIVDSIFSTYIKRWGRKQPLLTQYCDGIKVQCPGWLTQWGSKYLADAGKAPYDILTNFYGTEITFDTAEKVSGIPKSYPGYILKLGYSGLPVRTIQNYLNRISDNYPAIPKVKVDGIYGEDTFNSVKKFQEIFNLPQIGAVDYATWYKISDVYIGVTKIAELRNNITNRLFVPHVPYDNVENIPMVEYPCEEE